MHWCVSTLFILIHTYILTLLGVLYMYIDNPSYKLKIWQFSYRFLSNYIAITCMLCNYFLELNIITRGVKRSKDILSVDSLTIGILNSLYIDFLFRWLTGQENKKRFSSSVCFLNKRQIPSFGFLCGLMERPVSYCQSLILSWWFCAGCWWPGESVIFYCCKLSQVAYKNIKYKT